MKKQTSLRKSKIKSRPRLRIDRSARSQDASEPSFIGKALRGLGGLGGSTLGALIGQPAAGAAVGNSLGASLSKWMGAGDYEVGRNSIVAKASNDIPLMHKSDQSVTVRHREYIGPINGSSAFTTQYTLTINPGLATTFPWLSGIAQNFQEYEMKGMVYHYIPSSGYAVSGTNSALGNIMIQTSYRSGDTPPTNKVSMLNEYWASESLPSESFVHPIECDPRENPFAVHYVRTGNIPSGEPLLYDLGTTFVCTQGMQANNVVGDLWVTYEVTLKKPIMNSNVTSLAGFMCGRRGSPTTAAIFAGASTGNSGNMSLPLTGNTISLPIGVTGNFVIHVWLSSASGLTNGVGLPWQGASTLTNCSIASFVGTSANWQTVGAASTFAYGSLHYAISVTKTDASVAGSIVLPSPSYTGTADFCEFTISNLGLQ